jgi:hypothetical protein
MDKAAPAGAKTMVMSEAAGYRNVTGSDLTLTLPPCWENAVGDVRVSLEGAGKSTVYLSVREQETLPFPPGALAWFEVEGPQGQPPSTRILNVHFDKHYLGFLAIRFKAETGAVPSVTFFPIKPRKGGGQGDAGADKVRLSLTDIIN